MVLSGLRVDDTEWWNFRKAATPKAMVSEEELITRKSMLCYA